MKDYSSIDIPNPQINAGLDATRFIPYASKTQKSYRRASIIVLALFLLGIVFVAVLLILNSLKIKDVNVSGNSYYSEDELCAAAGITSDSRFFELNAKQMEELISVSCPRVERVSVKKSFPRTVTVTVTESELKYYFEYNSRFYSLTKALKVVEESKQSERFELEGLVLIKLPDILSVRVGFSPEFNTDKSHTYIETFLSALSEATQPFASADQMNSIDLTNKFDILITLNSGSRIEFGKAEMLPEKMLLAQTLIDDSSQYVGVPFRFSVKDVNEGWYGALTDESIGG